MLQHNTSYQKQGLHLLQVYGVQLRLRVHHCGADPEALSQIELHRDQLEAA